MATKKKSPLAGKSLKAGLSGGGGQGGTGSDLKGGGGPGDQQGQESRDKEKEVTSAPVGTSRSVSLTVPLQERSEWCWVAVAVGVDRFFRPGSTHCQCEIASSTLTMQCCKGTEPAPLTTCNTPHAINPVLGTHHLLAADPIMKPLSFDSVRTEIDAERPVCVLIKWLDSQGQVTQRGHFIAINGYRVTPGQKQFVSITDPMYGSSEIDFDQFTSGKGGYRDGRGVWFASFLVGNMKVA